MKHVIAKLFLLLLLAMAGTVRAQGYQSYFGADSTLLNVHIVGIDSYETALLTINSTDSVLINDHVYLMGNPLGSLSAINFGNHGDFEFYFREDTNTGRLYRYIPSIDEELLLCDMSLSVGDTFSFPTTWGVNQSIVDQISYINGKKVIYFEDDAFYNSVGIDDTDRTTFIEGTFPNCFPLGFYDNYFLCFFYLLCESKDGEQVFDHPYFESCFISYYDVNEKSDSSTKIYPTSACFTENIRVETSEPILDVILYDLCGREVPICRFEETPCHWKLSVQSGASGVYIIRITTTKGISYEKIVIRN